jgi:hypothetical protein
MTERTLVKHRLRRMARQVGQVAAMGLVLVVLVVTLVCLSLAELLVAGLRRQQRDRLGLWSNRLLRLAQRLKDSRERLDAAIQIAGE